MRGTTTAGDTAARTAPIKAASIRVILRIDGANRKKASISKLAGTNAIKTAGRPTFFKSDKSSDRPAFSKMIINAIWRSSAEIDKIDGSSRFRTYGPKIIPVISIPIMRGSFNCWQIAAVASPTRKIRARDVNIKSPPEICSLIIIEVRGGVVNWKNIIYTAKTR